FARWAWLAALAVAAIVLFLCFLRFSWTYPVTSDGADQALQGWDMLHGNLLLHGWTIADVTYYTTEVPQYMLIELVRGLGADVVHIAGAMTYTLLVLAAGLLARGRATGRDGLIRFVVAAGIMLAPQFGNATHLLLSQPDHLGTQLPLLLVFLLLDRAPRRWYVPVTAGAVLTWVIIADQVALLDAAVPLVLVCGARVLWAVLRHRRSLASQWYDLSLVAASALSFAAATLAVKLVSDLHGYQVTPVMSATLAPLHTLPRRVVVAFEGILNIYGADWFHISQNSPFGPALGGLPVGVGVALAAVHLVGVALAAWGFFRAFRYFFDPGDLVSPVLATAIAVNVAAYVLSVIPVGVFDTREILAVLPFGAVLAGRMVPAQLAGVPRRLKRALACASVAVLACYAAALGYGAAQSPVPDSMQAVIPWLEAHHLTHGLGTYAESNLTTMDSGGRVEIRDVAWHSTGDLPRHFETKSSWDDPRHSFANFILTNSADHWGMDGGPHRLVSMIPRSAIAALHAGPPAHVYHYKTFTIMVWNHNLLDNLGSAPGILPGEIPCTHDCV
ncbi:MAG TPA: hypothetical protein VK594_18875, partial [Streptosporangiaceae bacterium]|nr:hypothetical protein [Streptosporangiaceae bacterium]